MRENNGNAGYQASPQWLASGHIVKTFYSGLSLILRAWSM